MKKKKMKKKMKNTHQRALSCCVAVAGGLRSEEILLNKPVPFLFVVAEVKRCKKGQNLAYPKRTNDIPMLYPRCIRLNQTYKTPFCRTRYAYPYPEGAEMGYIEVLLLSFGVALLALASVHANLDMEINPKTQDYKAITELVPIRLLVLENEHLNNVGKYRAFKSVSLPFNHNEDDDKDE
ncbi:hypothetical protein TEA_013071 [Camellia sinensis var. sinensis]|uniref:Uncharacterized protein n=1 Tax=Camellia sinensis var. sinensis TaxID=542762 RepID=A0A4V3WJK4_CAMSN|nr:hypothetical protein TEA_013071 [Camellia sinensis var. sinensis]